MKVTVTVKVAHDSSGYSPAPVLEQEITSTVAVVPPQRLIKDLTVEDYGRARERASALMDDVGAAVGREFDVLEARAQMRLASAPPEPEPTDPLD